jgi:hypothetical protein
VAGGWRRLHNEELHTLYASPNVIRLINKKNEMGSACNTHGVDQNMFRILVGKPEGKRPLGRPRRRWKYKM